MYSAIVPGERRSDIGNLFIRIFHVSEMKQSFDWWISVDKLRVPPQKMHYAVPWQKGIFILGLENRDQLDINAVNETGKYVVPLHLLHMFTPLSQIQEITFLTEIEWLSLRRRRKNNFSTDHIV